MSHFLSITGMVTLASGIMITYSACKKSISPYKDVVYLTAAETSNFVKLSADNTGAEYAITATSSGLVNTPVSIMVQTDTGLIAGYNHLTGKKYSPLPQGSYELSANTVTIASNTTLSDAIKFRILSTRDFKDGLAYLMPVTIKNTEGLPALDASKTIFIEVTKVVTSTVTSLAGNYFKVDFSTNNGALKAMTNVTYETRVMVNKFQSMSPYISSIMGIEENFLLRLGDVTVKPNQLQMAGGLTATNVPMEFATGTWYHIAAVYNGSQLKIYVNGEEVATKTANRTVDLTSAEGFYFGYSARGRLLDGAISEARVWSKALTKAEIINGMCGIDPATPGLEGYWKFNESSGNIAYDVSGKGHNATATSAPVRIPNVRCN